MPNQDPYELSIPTINFVCRKQGSEVVLALGSMKKGCGGVT